MKKVYALIILLLAGLNAMAQYPSGIDTNVYRINTNDVKRFVTASKSMNLTEADFDWMDNHPYESNKNAEVYQRILKSITAAGFKDYLEYSRVTQRVAVVYAYDQQGGLTSEQEQQMDEALNNPDLPEQYKSQMRQQIQAIKKQKPTSSELESITPYKKDLENIFAKSEGEG